MGDLATVCPAATPIAGSHGPSSVVCGALENANRTAQLDGYRDRGHVSPVLPGRGAADTIALKCAGCGVPGSTASYETCVIWRAEKARIAAARHDSTDGLRDEQAVRQGRLRPGRDEMRSLVAKIRGEG